jgi:hypothetical protein
MSGLRSLASSLEDSISIAASISEIFPGPQPLTLGATAAFAGDEYAVQLRHLSELWIANALMRRGFTLKPIMRAHGKQADFGGHSADGRSLQVECKVVRVNSSRSALKGKLENANRQFKADPEERPGVLVMQWPLSKHRTDSACLGRDLGIRR